MPVRCTTSSVGRSAQIFDELRADWSAVLGDEQPGALEGDLRRITAGAPGRLLNIPGRVSGG